MSGKVKEELTTKDGDAKEKKKPGRKPMTPEEKALAAKARAAEKEKADSLKPELFMQYQGGEIDISVLAESAKADFRAAKKRTLITGLKLYIKPEERAAYYVVNEKYEGKITF